MAHQRAPESWEDLQKAVGKVLADDGYAVQVEQTLPTVRSSVNFDVVAEKLVGGHKLTLAVECKHWRKNVPQVVVHAFRSQMDDLGADAGYIVSSAGFQSGAYEAAQNTSVRLVTWDEFLCLFAPDGPPLGPGLKATAQIVGGAIKFFGPDGKVAPWANSIITAGTVARGPSGGLWIAVKTEAPLPGLQEVNAKIGWEGFELIGSSDVFSTDPAAPTLLTGITEFTTPAGMRGLHPQSGVPFTIPVAVHAKLLIRVEGILRGEMLSGTWDITAHMSIFPQPLPMRGSFSVRLV